MTNDNKVTLSRILLVLFLVLGCTPLSRKPPASPTLMWDAILDHMKIKEYKGARKELKRYIRKYPKNEDIDKALFLLGYIGASSEKSKDAITYLKKYLEMRKGDILDDYALYYLGDARLSRGDYRKALELFKRVIEEYPSSRWYLSATEGRADALYQLGKFSSAGEIYLDLIRSPHKGLNSAKVRYRLALCQERTGERDAAGKNYLWIWIHHPDDDHARLALKNLLRMGDTKGIKDVDDEIKRTSNLMKRGMFSTALKDLKGFLRKNNLSNEDYRLLRFHTGRCYFYMRSYKDALTTFSSLSAGTKEDEISHLSDFWMGKIHMRLNRKKQAEALFNGLKHTGVEGTLLSRTHFKLAMIHEMNGKIHEAFMNYQEVLKRNDLPSLRENILWRLMWLSYQKGDYKDSIRWGLRLAQDYQASLKITRYLYWIGRSYQKIGEDKKAHEYFHKILSLYPLTYSAFLVETIRGIEGDGGILKGQSLDTRLSMESLNKNDLLFDKFRVLASLGLKEEALGELSHLQGRTANHHQRIMLSKSYYLLGNISKSMWFIRDHLGRKLEGFTDYSDEMWGLAYPLGYYPELSRSSKRFDLDEVLLLAMVREESSFNPNTISNAGAIGLMQIIPSTAGRIASSMEIMDFKINNLFEPDINITFGTWYMKDMLDRFKGEVIPSLAAYNAGPSAVSIWLKRMNGTPWDEFVEMIPYPETKRYIKKVLRSYQAYRYIYDWEEVRSEDG